MNEPTTTTEPRVELFVRGDMFGANDQQRAVLERLRTLDEEGRIETYDVTVWEGRVSLTGRERPPVVDQYLDFDTWASREGVDIDPFFTVHERESFVDGTVRELVLPVMCLAVYGADGLEQVAPNCVGTETNSVYDCLDDLEALDSPARRVAMVAED